MESAREEMERIVAAQRVRIATTTRAKSVDAFSVPLGNVVLVYREKSKKWEWPYKLYKYDNYKTACIKIAYGVVPFSMSAIKPFFTEDSAGEDGIMCNEPARSLPQVNQKVEVLWRKDEKYYSGTIFSIDEATQKRHILYDDGDKEFLDFN